MKEQVGARRWTLAGRMRLWYATGTLVLGGLLALMAVSFVGASAEREIQALLREEAEEFQAKFHNRTGGAERIEQICLELESLHPEVPLAFRMWNADGEWIGEAGKLVLLADVLPSAPHVPPPSWVSGSHHSMVDQRPGGPSLAVALDATAIQKLPRRYVLTIGWMVVLAVALSLVLGELFSRRVSRWLQRVAHRIEGVSGLGASPQLQVQGAPDEIREVADALRGKLDELHRADQDSRLMTAGLAHELGSPIQNLLGETEVLLLSEPDADASREVLANHLEELRQLADAVHNLTSLLSARRPAQAEENCAESFDLGAEAEIRLQREQRLAASRGVELRLETQGELSLAGDKEALMRALRNLVSNAVAWSPRGGVVSVTLDGRAADQLRWCVDDQGVGIPEDLRDQVFEPLYRGPGAKGRRIGYGLGLALVRSAVESQGGSVRIEDAPRGGARFLVELPRSPESA